MIFLQNPNILIGFVISLLFCLFLFNVIYFVMSLKRFKKNVDEKYSFLSMFPYELFLFKKDKINHLHFIVFVALQFVYFLCGVQLFDYYVLTNFSNIYCLILGAGFVFLLILNICLNIISPNKIKAHLLVATLYMLVMILVSGVTSLYFFTSYFIGGDLYIVFGVLFAIVSLSQIVITLNPKLSNWAKLESVTNDDGTTSLIRPKIFILAFSEWLTILLFNLMIVLLLITILVL